MRLWLIIKITVTSQACGYKSGCTLQLKIEDRREAITDDRVYIITKKGDNENSQQIKYSELEMTSKSLFNLGRYTSKDDIHKQDAKKSKTANNSAIKKDVTTHVTSNKDIHTHNRESETENNPETKLSVLEENISEKTSNITSCNGYITVESF